MSSPTDSSRNNLLSGIFLILATLLALFFANHPVLSVFYAKLKYVPFSIGFTSTNYFLTKPLLLWINDGLMAIFFLLVGLELKREFLAGQLANKQQILLPGIAALGGVIIPACIYLFFNYHDPITYKGWAIPVATDIAFVLGVLALLSRHIPSSLRVFLLALAIFDDLAAILIIAVFYTAQISLLNLLFVMICIILLGLFNVLKVRRTASYMLIGIIMWVCLLKSGVHAHTSRRYFRFNYSLFCQRPDYFSFIIFRARFATLDLLFCISCGCLPTPVLI